MTQRRTLFLSGLVFLVVVAVGGAFVQVTEQQRSAARRRAVSEIAEARARWLERQLDRSLSSTFALASILRQTGKISNFDSLAADMIRTYGGISSLQLAPGGVVSQIYPLQGNEAALGYDLLRDPHRQSEAEAAIRSRSLTVAGPVDLIQGGTGVIGRLPVFIPDESGEERFWGFVIALVRLPDLLAASDLQSLPESGCEYQLWRFLPETGERHVFAQSSERKLESAVDFTIEVPNGQWTLSVAPAAAYRPYLSVTLEMALVIVIGLLVAGRTRALLKQPEKLRREVELRTRELSEINAKLTEEINERKQAEEALKKAHDALEQRVRERTAELSKANERLSKQLAEHQSMEARFRHRLVIEEAVARVSRLFLSQGDTDLTEVLKILGEAVHVNRAYIFRFREQCTKMDNTHEWCAPDTEPQIDNLQDLDSALFPWWMARLEHGENIVITDVSALPPEAEAEKEVLQAQDIQSLLVVPIYSAAGDLVGFMGFDDTERCRQWPAEDGQALRVVAEMVTAYWERKKAEEELRKSEERYRKFFEEDLTGDFVSTPDGRVLACNPAFARIFGFDSVEEALRCDPKTLYPDPKDREVFLELLRKKRKLEYYESELRRRDGKPIHIIANVVGTFDDNGELVEYKGYLFDNTERKQLEEQLLHSQKMEAIGRLAGGIAHDFNNLLTAIMGYAEFMSRHVPEGSPVSEGVEGIKKASERAASLTRQLLAFSRRQVLQPKVLDLNSVVADMERMLRRLIGEDIELVTRLAPGLGQVKADPGQLEQVIMNLVLNARDAMPEGGQLTIETANADLDETYARQHVAARSGPHVVLSVSDTGHGMDDHVLSRIYEPFFTTKEKGKGTGLGLSTVYGIVQQSGGHIWVRSEPGRGTTFKIFLPRVEDTEGTQEELQRSIESLRGTETILLVEDEEMVRDLARRVLADSGYSVLEASHGEEAIQLCKEQSRPIHLMVADVIMPHLNGYELAQHLSQICPGMKVLYISGYTDDPILYRNILDQGLPFLQKPFSPEMLVRKVREVLDGAG
jgi:PAS domain S-box-containing protein